MIQISAGVSVHYDLKYSQVDSLIHRLPLLLAANELEAANELATELLAANDADLNIWARGFRKKYNTVELILSQEGIETLELRARAKRLHTMRSERGHARERHDLTTAASPGKAFHHHARKDFLSQVQVSHINKGGAP